MKQFMRRFMRSITGGRYSHIPGTGLLAIAGTVGVLGLGGILHVVDGSSAESSVARLGTATVHATTDAAVEMMGSEGRAAASVASASVASARVASATAGAGTGVVAGMTTAEWDLPNLEHARVDYWVDRFATNDDMREKFEGFLQRSGRYQAMISAKLAERGMPQDLIFLAMIESGFQPHAYSHAAASGLWQFIAETGRRYGLRIDMAIDERNDPERATEAALDYLEELYDRFDSWYLAAAAYNSGENRVARIMRQQTGSERASSERDYYRIWNLLPRETRDYVPLMIAAGRIAKDPATYGFDHVVPEPALEYEKIATDAGLSLAQVAEAAGADEEDLRLLNPQFRNGRLPRGEHVAVRLPEGTAGSFQANWEEVASRMPDPVRYTVRRGDNLSVIASRHGVSVSDLRSHNGLRGDRIYAGQTLEIATR